MRMLRSNDLLETVRLKQRAAVMLYAAFAINNGGKVAGVWLLNRQAVGVQRYQAIVGCDWRDVESRRARLPLIGKNRSHVRGQALVGVSRRNYWLKSILVWHDRRGHITLRLKYLNQIVKDRIEIMRAWRPPTFDRSCYPSRDLASIRFRRIRKSNLDW